MKKYERNGYMCHEYSFKSLDTFLNFILNESVNEKIFDTYNLSSVKGSYDFTKTESFDEAVRLCKYGLDEKFENLLDIKSKIDKKFSESNDNSILRVKKRVGFVPSIKDCMIGNPNNMWYLNRIKNYNVVTVYVNTSYSHYVEASQIYNRGAITLSLIDILEKMGYAVRLVFFEISHRSDELLLAYFNIKDEKALLNIKKAHFPMCHPSFLRRLIFRLTEVTPFKREWSDGYGTNFDKKDIVKILNIKDPNIIFVSNPREMGIEGDNIYEDLENYLRFVEIDRFLRIK